MKNIRPIYVVLAGSLLITAFLFLFIAFLFSLIEKQNNWIFILPLITGIISFIVFFFLIRIYITEKITILYRSIRKGKFTKSSKIVKHSMTENIIEIAEKETKKWTNERIAEISKLKEQENFRREFLGNLAHELKTPVFSIQGYILTLLDGGLEDPTVNRLFLEKAYKSLDRMTLLLEDLDQIIKLEVEQIPLKKEKFDIKALVLEIFDVLETQAKEKEITLHIQKNYDPIYVYADRNKIGQVLHNLILNSINYGKINGKTSVRFYELDDIITTEVSDNGLGIDETDIPRIFERFYRVEKSRTRNKGGTGLGLAIVKHIIERHEQTINVRSTLGVGSTFTFSLDKAK